MDSSVWFCIHAWSSKIVRPYVPNVGPMPYNSSHLVTLVNTVPSASIQTLVLIFIFGQYPVILDSFLIKAGTNESILRPKALGLSFEDSP
jgi:hypothetical protein